MVCAVLTVSALNLLWAGRAEATPPVLEVSEATTQASLLETMDVSQAIPIGADFDTVRSGAFDARFAPAGGAVPNLNGEEGPVWLRATLRNVDSQPIATQVVLKYPQPQRITFYIEQSDSSFAVIERGSAIAIGDEIGARFPHARVMIPAGSDRQVYARLQSNGPILAPFQVFSAAHFDQTMARDNLLFGLLAG